MGQVFGDVLGCRCKIGQSVIISMDNLVSNRSDMVGVSQLFWGCCFVMSFIFAMVVVALRSMVISLCGRCIVT